MARQDEIDSSKYMEFMESTLDQITSSMDLDFDTILGKPKQTGLDQYFWNQKMELDQTTMGVIGILAGILILSGWVPQIVKGYKTKKLNDVSAYLMILIFAGAVLWLVYGIALDDVYIMGVNLSAMVLTMIVLSMKLKYEKSAQTTSE